MKQNVLLAHKFVAQLTTIYFFVCFLFCLMEDEFIELPPDALPSIINLFSEPSWHPLSLPSRTNLEFFYRGKIGDGTVRVFSDGIPPNVKCVCINRQHNSIGDIVGLTVDATLDADAAIVQRCVQFALSNLLVDLETGHELSFAWPVRYNDTLSQFMQQQNVSPDRSVMLTGFYHIGEPSVQFTDQLDHKFYFGCLNAADAQTVAGTWSYGGRLSSEHRFKELIARLPTVCARSRDSDELAAFVLQDINGNIHHLFTTPKYRNQGLGGAIISKMAAKVRAGGYTPFLFTESKKDILKNWYATKLPGWRRLGRDDLVWTVMNEKNTQLLKLAVLGHKNT